MAGAPSPDELDVLLDEVGGDATTLVWALDRPLLPREAEAILQRHQVDPSNTLPGRSRETLHAAERQLRLQARAFAACRSALLAGDAVWIPAGNPMGSGQDEVRELLTDAAELRLLLRQHEAVAALSDEHLALAEAFGAAAERFTATALHLKSERHRIHGLDYQRLLLGWLEHDEQEAARRKRMTGVAT